jgi:hypothetical protein
MQSAAAALHISSSGYGAPAFLRGSSALQAIVGLLWLGLTVWAAPALADSTNVAATANADSGTRLELATQLLKDSGAANSMSSNIRSGLDEGIEEQHKQHPEISEAFWAEFRIEAGDYFAAHSDELLNVLAQLYAERFSQAELTDAINYFEHGMGKKLSDPQLQEEARKRGEAWGASVGETISNNVLEKLKGSKPK